MSLVDGVKMREGNRCKEDEWENMEDRILVLGVVFPLILFLIDKGKWILRKLLYYRYTIDALDFFLSFVAAGIDEVNCWKTGLSLLFWSPAHYPAITRPMLRTQRFIQ